MAADYWRSSQCHNWQFTHEQLALARLEDARFASPLELSAIGIWIGNTVSELCKRLVLRQRVTATATVFARRFYAKNSYSATDPCLVCASCVYVAAKVEEMPIHVKQVVTEAMRLFAETSAGKFSFPSDRAILAEMEFYLIEDLQFDLIIHHPYRALVSIYDAVSKDSKTADAVAMALQQEIKPQDVGKVPYKLDIFDEHVFQMAWAMLNDVYRTDITLLYPPYLIALATVCLALVVQEEAFQKLQMGQISLDIATATGMGTAVTTPRERGEMMGFGGEGGCAGAAMAVSAPISVERVRRLERVGREIVEDAEVRRMGGGGMTSRVSPSDEAIRRGVTTSPAATRGPAGSGIPPSRASGVGIGIGSLSRPFSPVASSPMGGGGGIDHPTPAGSSSTRRPLHPTLPPRPPHPTPRPDSLLRSTSSSGGSSLNTLQNRAQPPYSSAGGGQDGYSGPGTVRTPGFGHSPALMTPPPLLPTHAHTSSHLRTSILAPTATTTSSSSSSASSANPSHAPRPSNNPPANPLGLPTDPPPHPLILFLASLNMSIPTLAEIVQELVSGYEVWHACKGLVDDGRGMLGLLEGMRERRRVWLLSARRAARAEAGG
ncbi:hypothetical protein A4X13_0g6247 [Tilletia indica]|uniref:Cyclin-like domain-containing protein n=1 Tax=Tilletia indica TaxID=43049 RepID=A0A177TF67_9BASI|nr:hypothetical protein A4X13_0g6247 [Tilletia indica]